MNAKKLILLNTVWMIFNFVSFLAISAKSITADTATFEDIAPFAGDAGYSKFLDRRDGKLYVYNKEMKDVRIYQIETLGKPAVLIQDYQNTKLGGLKEE